jgi:hypothetical protein
MDGCDGRTDSRSGTTSASLHTWSAPCVPDTHNSRHTRWQAGRQTPRRAKAARPPGKQPAHPDESRNRDQFLSRSTTPPAGLNRSKSGNTWKCGGGGGEGRGVQGKATHSAGRRQTVLTESIETPRDSVSSSLKVAPHWHPSPRCPVEQVAQSSRSPTQPPPQSTHHRINDGHPSGLRLRSVLLAGGPTDSSCRGCAVLRRPFRGDTEREQRSRTGGAAPPDRLFGRKPRRPLASSGKQGLAR